MINNTALNIKEIINPSDFSINIDTDKIIRIDKLPNHSIDYLHKELGISLEELEFYYSWLKMDNEWSYFKKCHSVSCLLNELVGEKLTIRALLDTIHYKIVNLQTIEEPVQTISGGNCHGYGLLSKNFRKPEFRYFNLLETSFPSRTMNDKESIENLLLLKFLCKDENNYKELMIDIGNMMMLGFYMGQDDQNIIFKRRNCYLGLSTLHDYEYSFSTEQNWSENNLALIYFPSKILEHFFKIILNVTRLLNFYTKRTFKKYLQM